MAEPQTKPETERRQSIGVDPHQGVEVFDTNGAGSSRQQDATIGGTGVDGAARDDAGFGHADLHNAEVIRGNTGATDFRSTDLRNSELNTADISTTPQGTNWSTILMVIALILLIILVGSWLF